MAEASPEWNRPDPMEAVTRTFWAITWPFHRVEQAIIPDLKEGSLGYLLIIKS